jgi:hypothetical protein
MPTPPNVENLTIGKGILYAALFTGGTPGTYMDLGEVPSIELDQAITRLPYYSARSGMKTKGKNPVTLMEYTLNFVLSEFATENIQKAIQGSISGGVIAMYGGIAYEWALKFVENNPAGPNRIWNFWKGTLSANGAIPMISDEWRAMPMKFEGLADTTNHIASPFADVELSSSSSESSSSSSSSCRSSSSSSALP